MFIEKVLILEGLKPIGLIELNKLLTNRSIHRVVILMKNIKNRDKHFLNSKVLILSLDIGGLAFFLFHFVLFHYLLLWWIIPFVEDCACCFTIYGEMDF